MHGLRPPRILIIIVGFSKSSYAYFKGLGTGASPRDDNDNDNKTVFMHNPRTSIAHRDFSKPFASLTLIIKYTKYGNMFGRNSILLSIWTPFDAGIGIFIKHTICFSKIGSGQTALVSSLASVFHDFPGPKSHVPMVPKRQQKGDRHQFP